MPCYTPLKGWLSRVRNESGKRSVVFKRSEGLYDREVTVPCGQCIGCRLERSRQWAMRCVHESSLYDDNCFITLTYSDTSLPDNLSLNKKDFQKFIKRLRKKYGKGIRYYMCGEYGEKFERPHYHACLFNFDFPDKELWTIRNGVNLYRSESLEKLWPFGFATIGDVTFESAAYVARYIMKKINGDSAKEHYKGRVKEYTCMSRRPGIGKGWFDKFKSDVYPHDEVIVRDDVRCRPPKYYDSLYDLTNDVELCKLKAKRMKKAKDNPDNIGQRLAVRGRVKMLKAKKLRRGYETESI